MNTKILTIDQGTTSSRAVIFGENMEVIDQSQQEYPLIYPADGWVEIDPNVLLNSVIETLSAFKDEHIENVAITNQERQRLCGTKKLETLFTMQLYGKTEGLQASVIS